MNSKKLIVCLAIEGKSNDYVESVVKRYKDEFHCGENLFVYVNNITKFNKFNPDKSLCGVPCELHFVSEGIRGLTSDKLKLGMIKFNAIMALNDYLNNIDDETYNRFILCDADDELDYDKAAAVDCEGYDMVKGNILIKNGPDGVAEIAEYAKCEPAEFDLDFVDGDPEVVDKVIDFFKEGNRSKMFVQMPVVIEKISLIEELSNYITARKLQFAQGFNVNYADDFLVQALLFTMANKIKFVTDSWYTYVKTVGSRTDRTGKSRDALRKDGISMVRDYLNVCYSLRQFFSYPEDTIFEGLTLLKLIDIEPALKCRL